MPQHITVVNYDPEWPSKYVRERDYICLLYTSDAADD